MRHLYLAATGMNRGKTTAALGLLNGFLAGGHRTGFMKPVWRPSPTNPFNSPSAAVVLPRFWPVAAR